jgi:hypothetical protein
VRVRVEGSTGSEAESIKAENIEEENIEPKNIEEENIEAENIEAESFEVESIKALLVESVRQWVLHQKMTSKLGRKRLNMHAKWTVENPKNREAKESKIDNIEAGSVGRSWSFN